MRTKAWTEADVERRLAIRCYGSFILTDAVRPLAESVVPRQGYRRCVFHDGDFETPAIIASVSAERLIDAFFALLGPLGDVVNAVIETSHESECGAVEARMRELIDSVVLQSVLLDFQDLLLNDGCTGVAAFSQDDRQMVSFDEHKLLIVHASDLQPYAAILKSYGVREEPEIQFVPDGEHLHVSDKSRLFEVDDLARRLDAELLVCACGD